MSIRQNYDDELARLHAALLAMGQAACAAARDAVAAFLQGDKALAQRTAAGDDAIDAMERDIGHRCMSLLLRQQPVAADLRQVSATLKMVTDLERMGDAARDIAELAEHMQAGPLPDMRGPLRQMADEALAMAADSLDAFVRADLALARSTAARDDAVDAAFCQIKQLLAQALAVHPEQADAAIDCLMAAKYLERLGDHAQNVCEWAQFCATGLYKQEQML